MTKYRSRSPRYRKGKSSSIDAIGLFVALLMGAVVVIAKGVPWLWSKKIGLGRLHTNAFVVLLVLALLGSGIYLAVNRTPIISQRTALNPTIIPTRRPPTIAPSPTPLRSTPIIVATSTPRPTATRIPTTVAPRTATPRPTATRKPTIVAPRAATPRPVSPSTACCKHCNPAKSKPCGDSCISLNKTCTQPRGCACSP